MRRIPYGELGPALLDGEIFDPRAIGAPVAIPDQIGDGTKHFDAIVGNGAKIAIYEIGGQPARNEVHRLDFDFRGPENKEMIRLPGHRSIAPISIGLPLSALS